MRKAVVLAATLMGGGRVFAQEPPQGVPPQPEQGSPQPLGPPAPEQPPPVADPAYGDRPEPDPDGGGGYFGAPKGKDIVVKMQADRSTTNIASIAITAGSGLLFGGLGLYFHLDSKSATEEVGAKTFTGVAWSDDYQNLYDRAHRSATVAGVCYGVGGAALIGAAIVYIVTEPKLETRTIHPHVAAGQGGAVVGGAWSF